MKSDNLFSVDAGPPLGDEPTGRRSPDRRGGLGKLVRALVVLVALAAAGVVLYGIFQIFVCDLREVVFKGMQHRAVWLCR